MYVSFLYKLIKFKLNKTKAKQFQKNVYCYNFFCNIGKNKLLQELFSVSTVLYFSSDRAHRSQKTCWSGPARVKLDCCKSHSTKISL